MWELVVGKLLGWIPAPARLHRVVAARLCSLVHPTFFSYGHPLPRGELHIDLALELWSKEKPTTVRAVVADAAGQSLVANWSAMQVPGDAVPVVREPRGSASAEG